ncbi:MAG: (2Fe-2S)-binding protein [Actinobacteria bacterium]|nr:(2Fe-2S)-binding protein [Actinomycetota bacterium]
MRDLAVVVNGELRRARVEDRRLLSDFLRHDLGLRGTHVGCEHGVCGACTVRLDGAAVRSCLILAAQADGCTIETVEALGGRDGRLDRLQSALKAHHGLQCGFCTPGILMMAAEALEAGEKLTEEEVRDLLCGHLCRCTGYVGIMDALLEVLG